MKSSESAFNATSCLPENAGDATLVGRAWVPGRGPVAVLARSDGVYDLSGLGATVSDLLELPDPAASVRAHGGLRLGDFEPILRNSAYDRRSTALPWFLAPCDLQAIKAAGVTFVASMLERVIEERAGGDAGKAAAVREKVAAVIGENLAAVRPGSAEALRLKQVLSLEGMWSQYLEVGMGRDAEVFTKSQPMSAVGTGAEVGIHPQSEWNNPEPEVVLAVNSRGEVKGATLGNDVNLRDFEGRSALLLGKAKDNNGSCAIGPFIRLFDACFAMPQLRCCELSIEVEGLDGFRLEATSSLARISRDPLDLVEQAFGAHHQYPDGCMLFLGTMFAPTQDRLGPGKGFTHLVGDTVTIRAAQLGTLVNRVDHTDRIPPWTYGTRALMRDLSRQGLLQRE